MWTMLAKDSAAWAQIGWREFRSTNGTYSRWTFVQWTDCCGDMWESDYTATTGYPLYNTLYNPPTATQNGWFQFERNNFLYPNAPYESWIPNNVEMLGETHNYADQMPGTVGSLAEFYGAQYRLNGRSATNMNTAADTSNNAVYVSLKIAGDDYRIGDRC